MRAADVMTNEVITVGEDASVHEAAKLLAEHAISAVPVVDRDKRGRYGQRRRPASSRRDRHRAAPRVVARNGGVDKSTRGRIRQVAQR